MAGQGDGLRETNRKIGALGKLKGAYRDIVVHLDGIFQGTKKISLVPVVAYCDASAHSI